MMTRMLWLAAWTFVDEAFVGEHHADADEQQAEHDDHQDSGHQATDQNRRSVEKRTPTMT